jgi:hypothetical protein
MKPRHAAALAYKNTENIMKFKIHGPGAVFDAKDLEDAYRKLADYLQRLADAEAGKALTPSNLFESGSISIEPD